MIDNLAILIFSSAIVYTVFRAIKLDKMLPWFASKFEEQQPPSKKAPYK
jgi:uncharacterized paraquat-inducible protein A